MNWIIIPHSIRVYHMCEAWIEKPIQRVTVWHHEACQMMTNGDPEWGFFFYSTLTQMVDFLIALHLISHFYFKINSFLNGITWCHVDNTMTSFANHVREFQFSQSTTHTWLPGYDNMFLSQLKISDTFISFLKLFDWWILLSIYISIYLSCFTLRKDYYKENVWYDRWKIEWF